MDKILQIFINKFASLRINKSHGGAPHKPILLLSVLQMFENDIQHSPKIYITAELVAYFKTNWSLLVTTKHDCIISYPFYHLKSEKFWNLVPKEGTLNIDTLGSAVRSFNNLNAAVEYAYLDQDLYLLMANKTYNKILQHCLLDQYFPDTKNNITKSYLGQLSLFDDIEQKILSEPPEVYRSEIKTLIGQHNEEEIFLRGSLFKREIPKIYNNTCCISGMRVDSTLSVSMIDACHIVPFSESYDDTITNGIALCPNLHRAFDRGLIGIDENYQVMVSTLFKEEDSFYSIRVFEGKPIQLPNHQDYYPLKENFLWHRKEVFRG
jgi:putative restriction endonuclease